MCKDTSPILPLRDLRQMSDGWPPEPKGDHSLVSQKGSNYFLRIDPNRNTNSNQEFILFQVFLSNTNNFLSSRLGL